MADRYTLIPNSRCPYSTGWPFSAKTLATVPPTSEVISFMSFIASMMQSFAPASISSPIVTNGSAVGEGARKKVPTIGEVM